MGKILYIDNLPFTASVRDVVKLFDGVANTESIKIVVDGKTGMSQPFGFVTMKTNADAAVAITRLQGVSFQGQTLTIREADQDGLTNLPGRGDRGGGRH